MSVVIAVKNKDGVYVGADRQATCGHVRVNGVLKIYKAEHCGNVVGTVGSGRDSNITHLNDDWIESSKDIDVDFKYVVREIVPRLFSLMQRHKRVRIHEGVEELLSTFLFCTKDRIFVIFSDGAVCEYENYVAIGSGGDMATGYLNSLEKDKINENLEDVIKTAIIRACEKDIYINDDVMIIKAGKE